MARIFSKRDKQLRQQPRARREDRSQRVTLHPSVHREPEAQYAHLGVYRLPDDAYTLIEDISRLDDILAMLGKLDGRTYGDGNESGQTLRRVHFILNAVRNQAKDRLAREFLAGHPPLPKRPKQQTLADIWEILKESLDNDIRITSE